MNTLRESGFHWVVLAGVCLVGIPGAGTQLVHEVNICSDESKFRCTSGNHISIIDLECGSRNGCSQNVNKTVFSLCHGQQTCSDVNIGQILTSQCRQNVTVNVLLRVKFTCSPGPSTLCRANLCANSSLGLTCPDGSLVHIRGLTCGSLTGKCSLSTYNTVYHVCERVNGCGTSGLRSLLSPICQNELEWKRNVIVQYICVPENLIDSTCNLGKPAVMDRHFGVIRSPSEIPTKETNITSCRWQITPAGFSRIKVIVQLVSARSTPDGCDARVLGLTSVDCSDGTVMTRWFCEPTSSGTEVVSCGDVWVISPSPEGQDSANTFIVTYQRYNTHDTNTIPDGLANCVAPQGIGTSRTTTHPSKYTPVSTSVPQQPSPKLMSVGRNYGPGDGIFEYRDTLYDEDAAAAAASNTEDNNILSKQLRLLVLYIFFGVVILVLVIALAAVIVSYHRISKCKDQGADSSEKTALWQHNEDTPMETFLNRSLGTWSGTRETTCTHTADIQTDQIVATVHHEATSGRAPTDPQCSRGSAITTFVRRNIDSDLKDTTNNFLQCSLTPNADQDDRYKSDQEKENRTENSDDIATSGTDHHTVPSNIRSTFCEVMDFNVSKSVCIDTGSKKLHSPEVDVPPGENQEDKLYEVANDDSSVVGHLQCPSLDLHYGVNNDDYTVVCRPGPATKTSHAASPEDNFRKRNANCADTVSNAGQCLTTESSNKQTRPSNDAGRPDQNKRCT